MSETPSARDFVERALRDDPSLSYADVKERAASVGLNVPPFLYGSLRRQLGIGAPTPSNASAVAAPTAAADDEHDERAPHVQREEADADDEREADRDDDDRDDENEDEDDDGRSEGGVGAGDLEGDDADRGGAAPGAPKKQNAFEFAREMLQLSPDISYQDLKLRGKMAGLHIAPIVFGRAKALLGLVPMKPRKQRERPVPPRTLQQVESAAEFVPSRTPDINGLEFVEQLVARVRQLEAERQQLRSALQQALALVREALD